jgi:hypothetical protein
MEGDLTLNQDYTVQQVIGGALINSDFHNALMAVASSPSGGSVNCVKLGRWQALNSSPGRRRWSADTLIGTILRNAAWLAGDAVLIATVSGRIPC